METVGRFPCKSQFTKTHQRKKPDFVLRPVPTLTENFYQTPLVQRRPDHFSSYPPLFSLPAPPQQQQQQPPLLPLPFPHSRIQNPNPNPNPRVMTRSLSCQPTTNYRKNRNESLITPRKSAGDSKRISSKNLKKASEKDIDEQVRKMYNSSISGSAVGAGIKSVKDAKKEVVDFSGSVLAPFRVVQSPPPSSLPLPTFTLRPKPHIRSC